MKALQRFERQLEIATRSLCHLPKKTFLYGSKGIPEAKNPNITKLSPKYLHLNQEAVASDPGPKWHQYLVKIFQLDTSVVPWMFGPLATCPQTTRTRCINITADNCIFRANMRSLFSSIIQNCNLLKGFYYGKYSFNDKRIFIRQNFDDDDFICPIRRCL